MTRLIKRYPNRKLYDTVERRYIALRDVANLIRAGVELRVIEHQTAADVTARTLSQIIFKQQRDGGSAISHTVLATLVRAGERSTEAMRSSLVTSWGIMRSLDDELEHGLPRLWGRLGLATRHDLLELEARLDELASRIGEWQQAQEPDDP